jgi:alcohol dehydrogenase
MQSEVVPALAPSSEGAVPAGTTWSAEVGTVRLEVGPGVVSRLGEIARQVMAGQSDSALPALSDSALPALSDGALPAPSAGTPLRAFLVTDPGVRSAGHAQRAAAALESAGVAVGLFDGVGENPSSAEVEAGRQAAAAFSPDLLVAVGGGSALDCAKGINFLLTNGGRMEDYWGFGKARLPLLPAIGVPTTAGTGSDAQSYALISQEGTHRKMACGDRSARFRAVLLDPELAATVPRRVAAIAGLDALSHAVESFVSRRRNPVSRLCSREAWRLLEGHLERFLAVPGDRAAAEAMLLGAHLAGAAIENSMLGAAHGCANPLTARHGVPHGIAVALGLPHVVRWNASGDPDLYRGLDARFDGAGLAVRIEELRAAAGLPARLSAVAEWGIGRSDLPGLAAAAAAEWTSSFNPRPATPADLLAIYEAAW